MTYGNFDQDYDWTGGYKTGMTRQKSERGRKAGKEWRADFRISLCELRIFFNQTRGDHKNRKQDCAGEFYSVYAKFVSIV